ncbi:Serine threonine kinase 17b [Sporothrix bragantina]|uniref:non-specific serine/threonine protein kinase n=1 Tax=Sporothrix bragantina TaxID=671064 RepID=A0ABP0CW63_9PEZI
MDDFNTIFVIRGPEELLLTQYNKRFWGTEQDDYAEIYESQHSTSSDGPALHEDDPDATAAIPFDSGVTKVLRITTEHVPKDATQGFIIGRNNEKCDIVLDNDRISGKHCAIGINLEFKTLFIDNLNRGGTYINIDHNDKIKLIRRRTFGDTATTDVNFGGKLIITIYLPRQPPQNWPSYCEQLKRKPQSALSMEELRLNSETSQTRTTTLTATTSLTTLPAVAPMADFHRKYIRGPKLGVGAMGLVYRVTDRRTGRYYAMKEFTEFMREEEGTTLMKLQHDHIVRYKELLRSNLLTPDNPVQLIMEYVDGRNLQQVLTSTRALPTDDIREILRQLLDAVDYSHKMNITHRDIKPANVILVNNSTDNVNSKQPINVKLVDFGFASEKNNFNTSCGTKLFIAPENFEPKSSRAATNKVDIFALGVLALQLMGETFNLGPYHMAKTCCDAVLARALQLEDKADRLSPELHLAMLMLKKDPLERPSAEECLKHDFFASPKAANRASGPGLLASARQVPLPLTGIYDTPPHTPIGRTKPAVLVTDDSLSGHNYNVPAIRIDGCSPEPVVPAKRSTLTPPTEKKDKTKRHKDDREKKVEPSRQRKTEKKRR